MEKTTQTITITEEPSWLELLGSNNWEGLLEPLNLSLRRLILRCGDFCQVTYDSFNNDTNSKYAGSCRYGKKSLFSKVMLESASDYQVEGYIYATAQVDSIAAVFVHSMSHESWDRESNWIGYVAVTTDEVSQALGRREIYVAWRGTITTYEWLNVYNFMPVSAQQLLRQGTNDDESVPMVEHGWLSLYVSTDPNSPFTKLSARTQLQNKIQELREKYKNENLSITVAGHSLGATLAVLSAFDLVENGVDDIPVSAFVFGCPQVGNSVFRDRLQRYQNLKILHTKNKKDQIPILPGAIFGYVDTGIKFEIDTTKSPHLNESNNNGDWHNLQGMLHGVAGWNGPDGEFEFKVKRSLALVNKSSQYLKNEYLIPGSWWVEKNKGMVLDENGEWVLEEPAEEDQPVPEF